MCRLFLKTDPREKFSGIIICHPSRRKSIGGWRKTQKLPQKVSDGKKSLSIIHVQCVYLYNYSMVVTVQVVFVINLFRGGWFMLANYYLKYSIQYNSLI